MARGARFAGVPTPGGSFVNLVTGQKTTVTNGSLTTTADPVIGWAANHNTSGVYNAIANPYSETPTGITIAAIFTPTNFAGFDNIVFSTISTANNSGVQLMLESGNPGVQVSGGFFGAALPTQPLTINTPYFIVVSFGASAINWGLINLRNGKFSSISKAPVTPPSIATTWSVGSSLSQEQPWAAIAAIAYSVGPILNIQQIKQWLSAPWDYWYPPMVGNLLSLIGQAAKAPVDLAGNLGGVSSYG